VAQAVDCAVRRAVEAARKLRQTLDRLDAVDQVDVDACLLRTAVRLSVKETCFGPTGAGQSKVRLQYATSGGMTGVVEPGVNPKTLSKSGLSALHAASWAA
jgi:hypothetical protein